ncbi:MAG TPA: response regulator [Thermoanaerobaculia bacterium]|nr:response regulator [Thermoanaerobaculia bacterium]
MPKIYVVDDSVSVRKAIERMLAPQGLQVSSFSSGREALTRIAAATPDLVICDLVLPDVDGFEICREVREMAGVATVPLLLISGIVDDEMRQQAVALGCGEILKKPFSGEELVARVAGLLAAPPLPPAPAAVLPYPPSPALRELLSRLEAVDGFRFALLASSSRQVLESIGDLPLGGDGAAAELAPLMTVAADAASQLGAGQLGGAILEGDNGTLLARQVEPGTTLVLGLHAAASLGKARFYLTRVQRALRERWRPGPALP